MMTLNLDRTRTRWFDTLPFDVRFALAACEDAGMGVDETSDGPHNPVFYEIEANLLGCSSSIGALMGMVTEAVTCACQQAGVDRSNIAAIRDQIRRDVLAGSRHEGLNMLLRWVAVADTDDD